MTMITKKIRSHQDGKKYILKKIPKMVSMVKLTKKTMKLLLFTEELIQIKFHCLINKIL